MLGTHIVRAHNNIGHAGVMKTFKEVQRHIYGISKDDVAALLKHCKVCQHNRPTNTRAPLEPMVVNAVLERV